MDLQKLPFLTNEVARARKRRRQIRILIMPLAVGLFTAAGQGYHGLKFVQFALGFGLPVTLLIYAVGALFEKVRLRSFGLNLLVHSLLFTGLVFGVMLVMSLASGGWDLFVRMQFFRHPTEFWISVTICYLTIFSVTAIRGLSRKLGPGVLLNWIRGYYYNPKQEERIFMLLDMRDSTSLAEQLGDMKFSALVRDFLDDLTSPVLETHGQVSHYIGDEAVLTWRPEKGLREANCAQCFFRLQAVIDRRNSFYMETYGLVPGFKAGAHIGSVVATEVGKIKSEIVFHGDVLNTTARVQSMCNELGSDFLITSALADRLPKTDWLSFSPVGEVALKGKSDKVELVDCKLSIAVSPRRN